MALQPGTRLGRYEIVGPLGKGGMGEVYRGFDSRLRRPVAIKVVTERLAGDPAAVKRFEHEAQIVAALSHPNILALFDIGAEQGMTYVVTELFEGETLRSRLKRSPLSEARAVEIATALAEGLAAAHAHGISHRDLKPENVFLTSDGTVKILDFGLSRQVAPKGKAATEATTQTASGAVMGTPGYMSPEQVRGETVDARSDLFSLGCILYEMVAGRQAFGAGTASDAMAAVLRDEPELPAVAPNLARLISHCLDKDRALRFQSASDLLLALQLARGQRAKPRRLSRRSLILAVAGVAAAAVPIAYREFSNHRIESLAVLPLVNAASDPNADYLIEGITESLITGLSRIADLRVKSRDSVSRYKRHEIDPEAAGRELGVRAVLKGRLGLSNDTVSISVELIDTRDGALLWRDRYERPVREILALQAEIARQVSERLRPRNTGEEHKRVSRPQTDNAEAYQLYLMGRYRWNRRTEDTLRSAADYFQQAIEKDPNYARAWAGLADAHNLLATYGARAPAEAYPRAKAAANHALELDPGLAEAHASLGWLKSQHEWDWNGAENEYRLALELNPEYATAYHWRAWYLAIVGRLEEAVASVERARDLDPVSAVIHSRVGLFLYFARHDERALEQCRKSLDMDPTFAWGHTGLGSVYLKTGRLADAVAEIEKSANLAQRGVIELGYLGHAYALAGRNGEARKVLSELKELSAKRYVPPVHMAVIHTGLGERTAALELLEKAVATRSFETWYLPDPRLDPLRQEGRFQNLLRRLGLPVAK
jgi:serine/threonine-protein kinase